MNTNKLYDVLKAIGQVVLPAILTFISVLGKSLSWDNLAPIMEIGTGFIAMYNAIIVIWNREYKKNQINDYSTKDYNG